MNHRENSLEEIYDILMHLRGKAGSRRKFPKELWDSIIRLTKVLPLNQVCHHLKIHPAYLKRKMRQSEESLDFQEVSSHVQDPCFDTVVIELSTRSGLRAKIQGSSSSCLSCLLTLFGG